MEASFNQKLIRPKKTVLLSFIALTFATQIRASVNMLYDSVLSGDLNLLTKESDPPGQPASLLVGTLKDIFTDTMNSNPETSFTLTASTRNSSINVMMLVAGGLRYPARTLMTIFEIRDPINQLCLVTLELIEESDNAASLPLSKSSYNRNLVFDLQKNQQLKPPIQFNLKASPINAYNPLQLKLEKFIALREYSLNAYLFSQGAQFNYYFGLKITGLDEGINELVTTTWWDISPYASAFSSNQSYCYPSFLGANERVQQTLLDSNGYPLAIISSVYLQMGEGNQDDFKFKIYSPDLKSQPKQIYDSSTGGRKTGNFFFDFNSEMWGPIRVSASFIEFVSGTTQQFCSMQWFGWPHCQVKEISSVQSITYNLGQTGWIVIGTMTAHYEPDQYLQNNAFCYQGFLSDNLQIDFGTGLTPISYSSGYYTLDPETLEIKLNSAYFADNPFFQYLGTYNTTFAMCKDSRESSQLVPNSPCVKFVVVITVLKFCNQAKLSAGTLTLNEHPLVSYDAENGGYQISYYYSMGVVVLSFEATADCWGFDKYTLEDSQDQGNRRLSVADTLSYAAFVACQSFETYNDMCIFVDQETSQLYLFSHPSSQATSFSRSFQVWYYGNDFSGQFLNVMGQDFQINGQIIMLQDCDATIISPESDATFPLYIFGDQTKVTKFKKTILFTDSVGTQQLSPQACGYRQFSIRAKQTDLNYDLAKQLLDCSLPSHLCAKSSDNFVLTLDIQIQASQDTSILAGKTLVYLLTAGLKYYSAPLQTYQIWLILPELTQQSAQEPKTEVVSNFTSLPKPLRPVFVPKPDPIIDTKCGETIQLPSLHSNYQSAITTSFDFRAAKNFMIATTSTKIQISDEFYPSKYLIQVILNDSENLFTVYQLAIHIKGLFDVSTVSQEQKSPLKRLNSTDQLYRAAWIESLTPTGLLTIRFAQQIYVPISDFDSNRSLSSVFSNEPHDLINNQTLKVYQKSMEQQTQIEWTCVNFTSLYLRLQLQFVDPLQVSSTGFDTTVVTLLEPDRFVSANRSFYLFKADRNQTLFIRTSPQYQSEQQEQIYTNLAAAASTITVSAVVITLILQIIAKKVITQMLAFFFVLQLILLIYTESNLQLPQSALKLILTVIDILNLSSFDRKMFIEKLHLASGSIFDNLSGLSILGIAGALVLAILLPLLLAVKHPGIKRIANKVKMFFIWNFCIRYFQVSYVNMQLKAVQQLQKSSISLTDKITSYSILGLQCATVVLFGAVLLHTPLYVLANNSMKVNIRNLYLNLDTRQRRKVAFGLLFFIQRSLCVLVLCWHANFVIQSIFLQLIVTCYSIYLFTIQPFQTKEDAIMDKLNAVFLLIATVFQLLLSDYVTDGSTRFAYGVAFDCFLFFYFCLNALIVIRISGPIVILKIKRFLYQRRSRREQKMLAKFLQREDKVIECHENLQLAHQQNFVRVSQMLNPSIRLNPANLNIEVTQPPMQQRLPLPQIDEVDDEERTDRSRASTKSLDNLDKYLCEVIDQKVKEEDEREPWQIAVQIQHLESATLTVPLPYDFQKAIDQNLSVDQLEDSIQLEGLQRSEQNTELIQSIVGANVRKNRLSQHKSTQIKPLQNLFTNKSHVKIAQKQVLVQGREMELTDQHLTNQIQQKQEEENQVPAKMREQPIADTYREFVPFDKKKRDFTIYDYFEYMAQFSDVDRETRKRLTDEYFGQVTQLQLLNMWYVEEFTRVLMKQNGRKPDVPKGMHPALYQAVLGKAVHKYNVLREQIFMH